MLGARQCGKTTLARQIAGDSRQFFDLESSTDRLALAAAPERTLSALRGLVVLDEVQLMPELLPTLRVLADLALTRLFVVYPGLRRFDLDEKITALPVAQLSEPFL